MLSCAAVHVQNRLSLSNFHLITHLRVGCIGFSCLPRPPKGLIPQEHAWHTDRTVLFREPWCLFSFDYKIELEEVDPPLFHNTVIMSLHQYGFFGSVVAELQFFSLAKVIQSHNSHLSPTYGQDGDTLPSNSATKSSRLAKLVSHLWHFLSGSQNTSGAGIQSQF